MLLQALQQARQTAQATLSLFEHHILPHHRDEEQHLFVATIKGANNGAEKERVEEPVARLVSQHRHLEQMWLQLRPSVVAMAEGRTDASPAFRDEVMHLVDACLDHTRLEETVFLPLADEILSRCHGHVPALEPSAHLQPGSGRSRQGLIRTAPSLQRADRHEAAHARSSSSSHGPGRASSRGNSSRAVSRRDSSQSRPSRE